MSMVVLDFEKPIIELEERIKELMSFSSERNIDLSEEVQTLNRKLEALKKQVYGNLTAWQRVQIARHPARLYTMDYIERIMTDFMELAGDRLFRDDRAMVCGFAALGERKVMVIGHQKGRDTKENIERNFGCANPEGYRKAMRMMRTAERFGLPVVVFIDTPGAYPGIGAEERGQAQAIAENIRDMFAVKTPIMCCVIGEGGSGGALGVGVGDCVMMLENAYYSVISPEGCAAILWKDASRAKDAAEALKLTSTDLMRFGIVDAVVPEPLGGVHKDPADAAEKLKTALLDNLAQLDKLSMDELLARRYEKFRKIGMFRESIPQQ
jgi:acetyl-CoA carboxylase carboxyl transferase subunit alpha